MTGDETNRPTPEREVCEHGTPINYRCDKQHGETNASNTSKPCPHCGIMLKPMWNMEDLFSRIAELEKKLERKEDTLKPCPFCGVLPKIISDTRYEVFHDPNYANGLYQCPVIGYANYRYDDWNNAWAHKRIAELEDKLAAARQATEDAWDYAMRHPDNASLGIPSIRECLKERP